MADVDQLREAADLLQEKGFWLAAQNTRVAARELERARAERDELQSGFDIRRAADERAIEAWRVAHPGSDLVRPDHADLVVWLAARVEAAEREAILRKAEAEAAGSLLLDVQRDCIAAVQRAEAAQARIARLEEAIKGAVDLIADDNDFLAKLELEEALEGG